MKAMAGKTTKNDDFILIVEDDGGTRELEAQRLEPLGLKIVQAAGAEEAAAILKKNTPALMLLDYTLPGLNALELLARLRESAITIPPFLIATGRGDEAPAVEAMKAGACGCIIKDSDFFRRLLPAAGKALEKAGYMAKPDSAQKKAEKGRGRRKSTG